MPRCVRRIVKPQRNNGPGHDEKIFTSAEMCRNLTSPCRERSPKSTVDTYVVQTIARCPV